MFTKGALVRLSGRCKRARKAKKNMARRQCRVDDDSYYGMCDTSRGSAEMEEDNQVIKVPQRLRND